MFTFKWQHGSVQHNWNDIILAPLAGNQLKNKKSLKN